MKKYARGDVIQCQVSGITDFGIFVDVKGNYKGLIHISEVSNEFVRNVNDYVEIGDIIYAKIIGIDQMSKQLKLSIKDIDYANTGKDRSLIDSTEGFAILKQNLPIWMNEKLDELKKEE